MSMKLKVKLKTDAVKPVAIYVAPVSKAGLSKLQGNSPKRPTG